ncbi:MAG: hypothetical protein GXY34_01900 [Syntrophomonadaceae bacterium]|nr:hypothetical protein [Syntrophomonadaceae bacterium]
MKKRWSKGDPVSLTDLLKITPVANEILQLSEEMEISITDIMWIVNQIIDNTDDQSFEDMLEAEAIDFHENWDDVEQELDDENLEPGAYMVSVQINSNGRFPEIGFKAGMSDKEDISYFFDMVMEMLDKLE